MFWVLSGVSVAIVTIIKIYEEHLKDFSKFYFFALTIILYLFFRNNMAFCSKFVTSLLILTLYAVILNKSTARPLAVSDADPKPTFGLIRTLFLHTGHKK